jgi:5-methylthioadenosine/S-adenosylhomocysteine deaminase
MNILFKNCKILSETGKTQGYLAVQGDTITAMGEEHPAGDFQLEKDMSGKLLLPGLVNAHTHAAMTLLRGVGTDLPLQKWLTEAVFPVEAKLDGELVRRGSALALLEMLACGTTSFSDMYFYPEVTAQMVAQSGMKANLNYPVQSFVPGERYAENESARRLERFYRDWNGQAEGRIRVDCCLHAEYTCTPDVAAGTADFCARMGGRMHIHLSETRTEVDNCVKKYGKSPARWMDELGVLNNPTTAAHCVWLSEDDLALLREKNVSAVHNPTSNMKLGSGFAPVPKMLAQGLNVALGTDGAASNNNLNMMEEMHLASILHNGYHLNAEVVPARQVLKMATRNGALAQGRGNTGVLAVGKRADLMAIDLDAPHLTPNLDSAGLAVYAAQSSDVCLTMVDGKILYENGEYLTLDKEKICAEAKAAANKLYGV